MSDDAFCGGDKAVLGEARWLRSISGFLLGSSYGGILSLPAAAAVDVFIQYRRPGGQPSVSPPTTSMSGGAAQSVPTYELWASEKIISSLVATASGLGSTSARAFALRDYPADGWELRGQENGLGANGTYLDVVAVGWSKEPTGIGPYALLTDSNGRVSVNLAGGSGLASLATIASEVSKSQPPWTKAVAGTPADNTFALAITSVNPAVPNRFDLPAGSSELFTALKAGFVATAENGNIWWYLSPAVPGSQQFATPSTTLGAGTYGMFLPGDTSTERMVLTPLFDSSSGNTLFQFGGSIIAYASNAAAVLRFRRVT
jgi:hypothetical protein